MTLTLNRRFSQITFFSILFSISKYVKLMKRPIFPKKGFFTILALSHTISYGFLALCQNLEKTNDWVPRKPLERQKDRRMDRNYFIGHFWLLLVVRKLNKPHQSSCMRVIQNTPQCPKNCVIIGGLRKQIENIGGGLSIEGWIKPSAHHVTFSISWLNKFSK